FTHFCTPRVRGCPARGETFLPAREKADHHARARDGRSAGSRNPATWLRGLRASRAMMSRTAAHRTPIVAGPTARLATVLGLAVGLVCLGAAGSRADQGSWPSERPPRPLPAHDVKFPPYEIQTLPNGLQVVAVLHHEQPAVSMRLLIRAGSSFDRRGKLGVAHLAGTLLNQGTTTRSAQELA